MTEPVTIIAVTDLPPDIQSKPTAALMVAGANGQAARVAPCLFYDGDPDSATPAPTQNQLDEAKLLLLGAIVRWTQQGGGGNVQQTAGPFTLGTTTPATGYRLWPSEIVQLQEICSGSNEGQIGAIDTAPGLYSGHLPWCDVMFGSTNCSCGYDIAQRPIYENMPGL